MRLQTGGGAGLFEDERVRWAADSMMEHGHHVTNASILELGPLEGGHTFMLEQMGAKSIAAVEANTRAYLKCLIVKEIFDLKSSKFYLADAISFLENSTTHYDIGFVSGFLYHMVEPVKLIYNLSKTCKILYIWTHYYDPELCCPGSIHNNRFDKLKRDEFEGFKFTIYPYRYEIARDWRGFCGGPKDQCNWLSRQEILDCLSHFGFKKQSVREESNIHGRSMSIVASNGR